MNVNVDLNRSKTEGSTVYVSVVSSGTACGGTWPSYTLATVGLTVKTIETCAVSVVSQAAQTALCVGATDIFRPRGKVSPLSRPVKSSQTLQSTFKSKHIVLKVRNNKNVRHTWQSRSLLKHSSDA